MSAGEWMRQLVVARLDGQAHVRQQLAHPADVGDVGHVAQDVGALGQDRRRHQLEHRVLGPADGDVALEGAARAHDQRAHRTSMLPAAATRPGPRQPQGSTVSTVTIVQRLDPADPEDRQRLAGLRAPRQDALVVEVPVDDDRFGLGDGPFWAYERTVTDRPVDGGVEVTERITYDLAIPGWGWIFRWPVAPDAGSTPGRRRPGGCPRTASTPPPRSPSAASPPSRSSPATPARSSRRPSPSPPTSSAPRTGPRASPSPQRGSASSSPSSWWPPPTGAVAGP